MKKIFTLIAVLFLASAFLSAQADRVVGFWLTEEGTSQVQVYKGQYFRDIVKNGTDSTIFLLVFPDDLVS